MNTSICRLSTLLVLACAAPAFAEPGDIASQRLEIASLRPAKDPAKEAAQAVLLAREFETTYAMSSGRNLVVSAFGDRVRVRYGQRRAEVLQHDGAGKFVSPDGALAVQFELDRSGEPQSVRLSMPADWQ